MPPQRVSVIPNMVDARLRFVPIRQSGVYALDGSKAEPGRITVAVTARLAYRKGFTCSPASSHYVRTFPQVDFSSPGTDRCDRTWRR